MFMCVCQRHLLVNISTSIMLCYQTKKNALSVVYLEQPYRKHRQHRQHSAMAKITMNRGGECCQFSWFVIFANCSLSQQHFQSRRFFLSHLFFCFLSRSVTQSVLIFLLVSLQKFLRKKINRPNPMWYCGGRRASRAMKSECNLFYFLFCSTFIHFISFRVSYVFPSECFFSLSTVHWLSIKVMQKRWLLLKYYDGLLSRPVFFFVLND